MHVSRVVVDDSGARPGTASLISTPPNPRGPTHTSSATSAAIARTATLASSAFSRPRRGIVFAPCTTLPLCTTLPPSRGLAWAPGSQNSDRPTDVLRPRHHPSPFSRLSFCHQDIGRTSPSRYEKRYEIYFLDFFVTMIEKLGVAPVPAALRHYFDEPCSASTSRMRAFGCRGVQRVRSRWLAANRCCITTLRARR